jgi:hypothetical protein
MCTVLMYEMARRIEIDGHVGTYSLLRRWASYLNKEGRLNGTGHRIN